MKQLYSIIFIFIISCFALCIEAQNVNDTSSELIRKGARLHDRGNYEGAIDSYKKALEINPKSMSAIYEMSLSYLRLKDYANALKYSSKVLEANFKPLAVDAYIVKGTALSDTGKSNEAIKLFKEAIDKYGDEYLLHFNLGLCYFNKKNNALAIQHLCKAIEIDASHSSAFLLYAYALNDTKQWAQSFYAFHFFLLLEPNIERSKDAFGEMYDILTRTYDSNELVDVDGVDMRALYESLVEKRTTKDDAVSRFNYFKDASEIIFSTFGQIQDDSKSNLLWYFFVPTYQEILNSGYFETYCRYVSVAYFSESLDWWNNNQEEVDKFIDWFEHGQNAEGDDDVEMDSNE